MRYDFELTLEEASELSSMVRYGENLDEGCTIVRNNGYGEPNFIHLSKDDIYVILGISDFVTKEDLLSNYQI